MSDVRAPLLPDSEGWSTLTRRVRKAADGLALAVCAIGFVCSLFLLASTKTHSVCHPATLTFFHTVLLMAPSIAMMVALVTSESLRDAMGGGGPSRGLSLTQHLFGVLMGVWLEECAGGALGLLCLSLSAVLLLGAGFVWFYTRD